MRRAARLLAGRVRPDDLGQVAGVEAIAFGVLIFVIGSLLFANVWGTVDARLAVDTAAREGARAYVEGADATAADANARAAAIAAFQGYHHGDQAPKVTVDLGGQAFARCVMVTVTVSYTMPKLQVPFAGGFGDHGVTVTGTHAELVDPLRNDLPGEAGTCG